MQCALCGFRCFASRLVVRRVTCIQVVNGQRTCARELQTSLAFSYILYFKEVRRMYLIFDINDCLQIGYKICRAQRRLANLFLKIYVLDELCGRSSRSRHSFFVFFVQLY